MLVESDFSAYSVVSATVVPMVGISACGLLCLAFFNRLAAVIGRLREFQQELINEAQAHARLRSTAAPDRIALTRHQRLVELLETQSQRVGRRACLMQRALMCLLLSIGCLTLCSAGMGISVFWHAAIHPALVMLFGGLSFLLAAVIWALLDLKAALEPIRLGEHAISGLTREFEILAVPPESQAVSEEPAEGSSAG